MCGIIGYVGDRRVTDVLLKGLKRLEYRGYDSSGVALFQEGAIRIQKAAGKITEIESQLSDVAVAGTYGAIGHTRWATHGAPNTINAHPHRVEDIVLVHNGIIENYRQIHEMVLRRGYKPVSETDSELFAFLVHFEMENGHDFIEAMRRSFRQISGSSSIVAMCERHPGMIVGIRNGSPLVVAVGGNLGGAMLASDAQPIMDYSNDVTFLENGDMVVCTSGKIEFLDAASGSLIERKVSRLDWSADRLDKNGYPHYMLKEIHEQALTIRDTLSASADISGHLPFSLAETKGIELLERADRLSLVACGTSWHASLLGKYWFERFADLPAEAELASEFRYRKPVLRKDTVVMGVSQSGETADTLAVLNAVKKAEFSTLAITNVKGSSIAREVDHAFYTCAGPEIGVASTKAFTGQMLMLLMLAGRLGRDFAVNDSSGRMMDELAMIYRQLFEVPLYISTELQDESPTFRAVTKAAEGTLHSKGFFFIGRGYSFPLALEGALKLKEIAYVHAEGYAAGELKHGPIAMLEPDFTVIVIAPRDAWYEKTISNLQEVKARGAKVIGIGHADDAQMRAMSDHFIPLPINEKKDDGTPVLDESLLPFLVTPILQLFSYKIAVMKGTDVDQPRNLAKSVTVE
jgi:glucosamine--fructose-6-phosphate aminotransferase (isomerizing)